MNNFLSSFGGQAAGYGLMYFAGPEIAKRIAQGFTAGFSGPTNLSERVRDVVIETMNGITKAIKSTAFQDAVTDLGQSMGETNFSFLNPIMNSYTKIFDGLLKNVSFSLITKWLPTVVVWGLASAGTPLVLKYLYERAIFHLGTPKLLMESRTITWLTPFFNRCGKISDYVMGRKPLPKPIFSDYLAQRVKEIVLATVNIIKHGGFLQNLILYGPGGTGKTMIAKEIARSSGMNFIMMSGAALAPFIKSGKHVSELQRMIALAKSLRGPALIFIDEVDALARHRDKLDQDHTELLNALLEQTGEPSKKVMIIAASNRLSDMDPAFLSRMDHKLYVAPPGYYERVAILRMYIDQMFDKLPEKEQFFKDKHVRAMALKTSGLTGRALFKLVNAIYCKKASTADNRLTIGLINRTIKDFVQQERDMPEAVRSWRVIELISDLFLFTLPDLVIYLVEAAKDLSEYLWKRAHAKFLTPQEKKINMISKNLSRIRSVF